MAINITTNDRNLNSFLPHIRKKSRPKILTHIQPRFTVENISSKNITLMIYLLHQFGADSDTKSLGLNGFLIRFPLVVALGAYSIFIFEKKRVEHLICIPLGDVYVI